MKQWPQAAESGGERGDIPSSSTSVGEKSTVSSKQQAAILYFVSLMAASARTAGRGGKGALPQWDTTFIRLLEH